MIFQSAYTSAVMTTPLTPRTKTIPVIGLLGAVASGKSAVAAGLESLGASVFDADKTVGGLLETEAIVARIAREIDAAAVVEGAVDRRRLADLVFTDASKRAALEAILHPLVIDAARSLIASPPDGAVAIIIDAPLLLEAGMETMCDELWYVDSPLDQREKRAKETRGWSAEELARRESAQISPKEKRRRANRVIPNDSDLTSLESVVISAWKSFTVSR